MIARAILPHLLYRLGTAPAAALLGPRQCGKTTLARSVSPLYFDLEHEPDRVRLDLRWEALANADELVILDEAQAWPEVFPRLRGAIDSDRQRTGRFLVLGSVAPALMTQVSQSLAGRLALLRLAPLSLGELGLEDLDRLWLLGGYPDGGILGGDSYPTWQRDHLSLLAARDLPAWGLGARPQLTDRLLRMLASVHGQAWNASQLGSSLGLSHPTVKTYLDHLDGAFLVRILRPWQSNLKKRLVKSPKVYWRDSGLLHALHLVRDLDDLFGRPWVGASWEGFVIEQVLTTLEQRGVPHEAWTYRTRDGQEIDLLLDFGASLWAIEIKLTTSPSTGALRSLQRQADNIGARRRFLVHRGPDTVTTGDTWSCRLEHLLEALGDD